ncbi:MAG: autotransporter-associated beta strand repeat-containing protein [Prosthecobacter sp.]
MNTLVIDAANGGTLDLNGGDDLHENALVVTGAGSYTIQNGQLGTSNLDLIVFTDATGTLTLDTSLSGGAGSFIKQGSGTAVLTGTSTYTGSTIIGGGTLSLGSSSALVSITAVVLSNVANTNLDITGFDTTIGSLSGGGSDGGNVILGANTLTVGTDNTSTTFGGVISGAGQLVKTGDGTLTLTRASTFTGDATISQGIVNLQAGDGLGTSGITVTSGATLQLQGGITVNTGILTLNSGAATGQSGGLVNVSGNNTYNKQITIAGSATAVIAADAGTLTLDNGTTTALSLAANQLTLLAASGATINVGTGSGNENIGFGESTLILDGAGNGFLKTFIASGDANGQVIKNGSGTWTLSKSYDGNNGWSLMAGETAHLKINAGTLKMGATNAISFGVDKDATIGKNAGNVQVNSGGTLDLAGFNTQINGLENLPGSTGGIVTNSSATTSILTLGGGPGSTFYRGTIQNGAGAIGVTKIGTGTQSLIGTNTFTGATTVTGGTLIMSANTTSQLTVGAGATFEYVSGTTSGANMNVTVFSLDNGSTFGTELGSTILVSGAAAVTTSTVITVDVFGIPGTAPAGAITLASATGGFTATGATYNLGKVFNATNFTVGSVNATDTDITITAAAATPLTTAYWNSGFTPAPTLWAISDGSTSSNWSLNADGTGATPLVPGAGTEVILSSTAATNQSAMALGANMSIDRLTISDTNAVTLNADGYSLTLNNSGGNSGISMSSGAGAAAVNSSVILNGSSPTITNDSTTNSLTIGGEISGSSGVTKEGAGTLVFTAANSYTGGTAINNGTLQIGNGGATGSVGSGAIVGSGTSTLAVNRSGTATFNDTINVPNLRLDAGTTRITADTTVSTSFASVSGAVLETTGNITLDLSATTTVSNSGGLNVVSDTLTIKPTAVSQLPGEASFYYSFNNSSSLLNDDTTASLYDGVVPGGKTSPTYTADGVFGGAVTFNGTNQGFQAGGTAQNDNTGILNAAEFVFTYASWIKIDPTQTGTTIIFEEGGSTNGLTLWTDGGDLNARIQSGTSNSKNLFALSVLTDGWHHIAFSFSDSIVRLYVDGVLQDSDTFAQLVAHNDNSGIGYLEGSTPNTTLAKNFFTGAMDEIYYFDDAGLSSSQIASLANGMSVTSLGPLTLNDGATVNVDGSSVGSATTLFDSVTSNGDATITGSGKLIGTTFNVDAGKTLTVENEITGAVGLKAAGPGTVVLSGTNTYAGVTQITGGTLSISSDDNLGAVPASAATDVILNGGTLRTTADMALSANRGITVGASGGGIETSTGTTLTMNDMISGAGDLTKSGDGVLLVTTDNSATHTGATLINAGTVQLATGGTTGSGDVILNGASAALAGTGIVAGNTSVLTGTVLPGDPGTASGVGTLTIAADATFTNGAVLNLQFTHANGLGTSAASNLDGSGDLDWAVITAAARNADTADLLNVTGLLTLNTDATIKLSTPDSGTFEKGMAWDLLDWGTLGAAPASLTFNVDSALSLDLTALGLSLDTTHFATNGIVAIVPEPGRMSLLACGLAVALLRRCRRPFRVASAA